MKIFLEKQFVKGWWRTMSILAVIVVVFGSAYYATENADEQTKVITSIISCFIAFPLIFGLLYLRLETRIDEKGLFTYFRPFGFTKKFYSWAEISECYVREYSPIMEYGGWGLRGIGSSSKAYNIWGNKGIQIVTSEGKKFLVGTQKPHEALEIINMYKPTIKDEI